MTDSDEEELRDRVLALRELVEGYRESHRQMFRQIRDLQAERDGAERQFWSLVARYETPLTPSWQEEFASDPFGELESLPPVTRRPGLSGEQSEILFRELDSVRNESSSLREENQSLIAANQELLWRIDELEKNQTAPPSIPPPDEEALASARQEAVAEVSKKFNADLSRKEHDLAIKTAELIRTSDQLRRASVDLELTRAQIEEDAAEISALRRRLEAAAQAIDGLQKQLAQSRSAATREPARPPADRQDALERQLLEWAEKAQAQESAVRAAFREIQELQALVVRSVVGLGRSIGRWEPNALLAAYRGFQIAFATAGTSDEELAQLALKVFPFVDQPSQPHYEVYEDTLDTEEMPMEDGHEQVDEDELLGTPPPVDVTEWPPSSSRPLTRSSRPPPLPSAPPPALEGVEDPFAPVPSTTPNPGSNPLRNQTMGWSPEINDPFPSSKQSASRNRTMLGFEASPEQVAQQKNMASSEPPGGKRSSSRLAAAVVSLARR